MRERSRERGLAQRPTVGCLLTVMRGLARTKRKEPHKQQPRPAAGTQRRVRIEQGGRFFSSKVVSEIAQEVRRQNLYSTEYCRFRGRSVVRRTAQKTYIVDDMSASQDETPKEVSTTADPTTSDVAPPMSTAPAEDTTDPPRTPLASTTDSKLPAAPVPQISEAELRDKLKQVFNEFDVDHSGSVSLDEMFQAADSLDLGIPPEKLAELIKATDTDGSGEVDFEEFLMALRKHMGNEGGEGGMEDLGSVFAAKSNNMFADLWSGFSGAFTSPFKALDNMIATPLSLFSGENQDGKRAQLSEEPDPGQVVAPRDLAEQLETEAKKIYGKWDLQRSPPRKAATPKRSDCRAYSPQKSLVNGVPKAKFATETQAKTFFAAPRAASTGAHSAAHLARMQVATNWSNPAPLPQSWGTTNVRPTSAPRIGLSRVGLGSARVSTGSTPPGSRR